MDLASLTLGLLGLVGGTVKAATVLRKKLKTFRHYSDEVKRVHKSLTLERHLYNNEVHLLLRSALDGDHYGVEVLLENPTHAGWTDEVLDRGLHEALGRNYDIMKDVIEDIGSTFQTLTLEIEQFEALTLESEEIHDTENARQRLQNRMKVAWDKTKWENHIKSLRKSNDDLRRLRQQAYDINVADVRPKCNSDSRRRISPEYALYGSVRRASSDLHRTLATAWSAKPMSTLGPSHQLQHTVKLFLDAKVMEGVTMDLVICCPGSQLVRSQQPRHFKWLRVQSEARDFGPPDASRVEPESSTGGRLRFSEEIRDNCLEAPTRAPSETGLNESGLSAHNLCGILCGPSALHQGHNSIGYIDSPECSNEMFRHSFYGDLRPIAPDAIPVPMDEMLARPSSGSISAVDQLQLACSLVSAVLKFYSTPWLNEYFSLQDLFCFCSNHDPTSKFFRTMHVSLDFTNPLSEEPSTSDLVQDSIGAARLHPIGMKTRHSLQEAQLQYGIRNLSLWCLGTILLQIGRWSRLDAPDDVASIRRLSYQQSLLGPKYRDLTKKCLECDFGFGDDLSKPRLQQAVYENLVCVLNEMIKVLSIADE